MPADLLQGFRLNAIIVEPSNGRVTIGREKRHLPPRAMDVLVCLAEHAGELVTRETLLAEVWGSGHGSHNSLVHAISEVRNALDDKANSPSFIETLPRRGYRLMVTPEKIAATPAGIMATGLELFANLKQRGVIETGFAYLFAGWVLIQVADVVFDQLHFPSWAGTFVTMLVIAGFPVSLVLSWFFEIRDGRAQLDDNLTRGARRRLNRTYKAIICALAIGGIVVYAYDRVVGLPEAENNESRGGEAELPLPPIEANSVAVLPFVNLDGSLETQVFANGLVEDVINSLSRIPGLRVASRGDAYSLVPNSRSEDVRRRLRVERYLEGSVEIAEEKMRVTVQLIDSANGFHILSRRFDRVPADIFDVRDEITSLTVANVRVALPPQAQGATLRSTEDPSLDAYVLYRRGIDASREPKSIRTIASALGWFDAALQMDPEYAAAHAGKCSVYVEGYTEVDDDAYIAEAESSCARALALNPNLDIVHAALGDLYRATGRYEHAEASYEAALAIDASNAEAMAGLGFTYLRQGRPGEAETALRQAAEIHPGNTRIYNLLGMFFYQAGRYEEAITQYQYVVALDPANMVGFANLGAANMLANRFSASAKAYQQAIAIEPTKTAYSNLGLMHYYLGDLEAAIDNHSRAVALQPNDHLAHSNLGDALWVAGREEEARRAFETARGLVQSALRVNPRDPFATMDLAWIEAMLGETATARSLMRQVRAKLPDDPYTYYYDALVSLREGDRAAALDALETAVAKGYSRELLVAEPHLAGLLGEQRFVKIVEGP